MASPPRKQSVSEDTSLAGESRADHPAELAEVTELKHDALIARDTIVGLRAELDTLKKKLDILESSDIGRAYARIDKLEDQREAMLHELRWAVKSQREQIANMRASVTWRVGSIVVRPVSWLRGRK